VQKNETSHRYKARKGYWILIENNQKSSWLGAEIVDYWVCSTILEPANDGGKWEESYNEEISDCIGGNHRFGRVCTSSNVRKNRRGGRQV
jgi:hypothetical protein